MSKPHLKSLPDDSYRVIVVSDGTHTQAEVVTPGPWGVAEVVGTGEARRRTWKTPSGKAKGDPRNDEIGVALALSRAFEEVSRYYDKVARQRLGEETEGE
jgi:hypothetical protein